MPESVLEYTFRPAKIGGWVEGENSKDKESSHYPKPAEAKRKLQPCAGDGFGLRDLLSPEGHASKYNPQINGAPAPLAGSGLKPNE